ncbi:type II toxin-antitoxin system RelE/ParE family toxin [Novosphingobium taihuense]|uniref:Toxin ParE1/3/4 n=1 Tax=Novosphingobium taihuense TaxID=260085 RepID=A0A7W7EVS4_9SPHN|nr:type II toxin-antitoxin system RelE/ParE family toxin [Novosphingobium taihuense]MBB4615782.1 toxin ParE1/3/4 [Novosphingobium taihuense]TWH79699.1 toxin ParE1/3/4 [Novosphingobium taihuense]
MPRFRLTRAAADDLTAIFLEGIEQFGLPQADTYHEGLSAIFAFLANYPHAARLREEISPPVRVHPYKAHLVIYDVGVEDEVIVLRVRHSREDWMSSNYDG